MDQMNYASAKAQLESQKGVANGFASLDGSGLIPSNQLPSYVDDVQEYASVSAFPASGEIGKIYVATDTNKSYRWSGTTYIELSSYALATQAAAGLMSAADKTALDGAVSDISTLNSKITTDVNEKIQSKGYNVAVSSSTNLETKVNTFDITKTGYTPISAIVVGTWDESQWVHTIRFNSNLTSMDVKSLHIGTSGSSISFAVRVAYRKND